MNPQKIKVRFVQFHGETIAVFMGRDAQRRYVATDNNPKNNGYVRMSYMHVGQHGECYDGMKRRKRSTIEQYTPLLRELESIGYNVTIV